MRLPLAIASFRSSDRTRRRLLRSVLSPLGAAPDRLLRSGAVAVEERARAGGTGSARAAHRADHRHAVRRHAVDRCTTCHIAADDPRFEVREPLEAHPYSTALGDYQRNGRWERRHKFSDFGCTVCHDGQGRGLKTFYSHGEDRILARADAGLRDPVQLAQGFRAQAEGQRVHGSQLRPVPHRGAISPARPT
jgi:hypothetical protein